MIGSLVDTDKFVAWLNAKWLDKTCPVCKNNNWTVDEKPLELRQYNSGSLMVGGPVYPILAVTCNVCGNTILFNAIVSQSLQSPSEDAVAGAVASDLTPPEGSHG